MCVECFFIREWCILDRQYRYMKDTRMHMVWGVLLCCVCMGTGAFAGDNSTGFVSLTIAGMYTRLRVAFLHTLCLVWCLCVCAHILCLFCFYFCFCVLCVCVVCANHVVCVVNDEKRKSRRLSLFSKRRVFYEKGHKRRHVPVTKIRAKIFHESRGFRFLQ